MSTKIKKPNPKKKNPNTTNYIIIGISAFIIIAVILVFVISGIKQNDGFSNADISSDTIDNSENIQDNSSENVTYENFLDLIDKTDAKKVRFDMTDGQSFTMEVYPRVAPKTCENFLKLVGEGFYDGLTFHRVCAGFMAQGGAYDPQNQANDPAESIVGEFSSNGFKNDLRHFRGVVSMARTSDPDSASSQFFICYDRAEHLDGDYAAFGYVTEGMDTVDSFLSEGTDSNDKPLKEVKIKSAKIVD